MAKCKILLVDSEVSYLLPLEMMFLREYGEKLDLQLITQEEYLFRMFETPQKIDVLVIHEALWREEYALQDIKHIFFLSEEEPHTPPAKAGTSIFKYTSVHNVFSTVNVVLRRILGETGTNATKLLLSYSPQGGSGKTTVALGVAASLASIGNRVLYVNTEALQTFGSLVGAQEWLDKDITQAMSTKTVTDAGLERNIRHHHIDYLLPMQHSLPGCGLTELHYLPLLETAKASGSYDFVVADTASDFTQPKASMMHLADHVIIPLLQNESGCAKMEALMRNIDTSDAEKFVFVCNAHRAHGAVLSPAVAHWSAVSEYIEYQQPETLLHMESIRATGAFMGLAYRFV